MCLSLSSQILKSVPVPLASAKKGLAGYCMLPFYQRVLTLCGYGEIIDRIKGGEKPGDVLTDELVSEVALVGPTSRCKETLSKWEEAGVDMTIITPSPVGKQTPLEIMESIVQVVG